MEVEALLCLTEAVIRSHKLREYNKRGGCFFWYYAVNFVLFSDNISWYYAVNFVLFIAYLITYISVHLFHELV